MRKFANYFQGFFILSALITLMSLAIPVLPPIPYDYVNLNLPPHFTNTSFDVTFWDNTPGNNPLTNDGATLGRVLFYDKILSLNDSISCGSCHKQQFSFADSSTHSMGFNGGLTRRNTMTITNARWHFGGKMFWDQRGLSMEDAVLMPIQDSVEMGLSLSQMVQKVEQQPYYASLFINAFGDSTVTETRISYALSQFIRSIVSHTSKYDIGRAQVNGPEDAFPNFTNSENQGKTIFFSTAQLGGGDCAICHRTEAFVNTASAITCNGLDLVSTTDLGVYEATGVQSDIGRFKVPSLRNIELTAPYMHDGRFLSLEEVVEFSSTGIQLHMNLPPGLIDTIGGFPVARQFNFSQSQKTDLVHFLKTLTDTTLLSEIKWSDPFTISTFAENLKPDKSHISIYPNPASNYISIYPDKFLQDKIVELEIFNSTGRKVHSQKVFLSGRQLIDISNYASGVYFVNVKLDGMTVTERLVKSF